MSKYDLIFFFCKYIIIFFSFGGALWVPPYERSCSTKGPHNEAELKRNVKELKLK